MTRTQRIQTAIVLALGLATGTGNAQSGIVARYTGTEGSGAQPRGIQSTPTPAVISFNPAAVGITAATAQTLTASFQVSGYTGSFTPSASLHYGLSYGMNGINCTGGASPETCTVTIRFQPQYPGARRDALFLTNGNTRLATVLLDGVGQAPMALFQPGSLVNTYNSTGSNNSYFYQSVTDENGTVWSVGSNVNTLTSLTKAGVFNAISITGLNSPQTIGIDGAGVLYIANGAGTNTAFITYDTVQSVQGTFTLPVAGDVTTVGVGNAGNIYAVDTNNDILYTIKPDGTSTNVALVNGSTNQPNTPLSLAVDSAENLFFGGNSTTNEYSSAGVQSTINTTSTKYGIAVDAADTVYGAEYGVGIAELPAANYAAPLYTLNGTVYPYGISVGADGTANVGDYFSLIQYVRSQGAIAFGDIGVGTTAAAQAVGIYNGGNLPLTISSLALTGTGFAMQSAATNNCTTGIVLAPGAFCQVMVTFTSPHAGSFSGSLAFTSNSLNNAATINTAALTAVTTGVYLVPSPAAVTFANQVMNTTSAAQTVTLTNNGYGQSATVGTPSSVAGFNVSLGTCTSALAVGGSCALNVTFTPTGPQAFSGTVTVPTSISGGGSGASSSFTVSGNGLPVVMASNGLIFNPAPVAVSQASAQTLTASFQITGYTTVVSPTAALRYGLAYALGTLSCTGTAGNQTCTVPVSFVPNYPGARRDAVVLSSGGEVIAALQVYGVGQGPFALVQPGVVTNPILNAPTYLYQSVVGEDGTVYITTGGGNTIISVSPAGVQSTLPITGLQGPSSVAIDGAGILYIAQNTYSKQLFTYNTATGVQGSFSIVPSPSVYTPCSNTNGGSLEYPLMVSAGIAGDLYVYELLCQQLFDFKRDGSFTATALNPTFPGTGTLAVDSAENVFIGGYDINEITAGGTQTQINTVGAGDGLAVDAADTLYATRYTGTGGVAELPATNYAQFQAALDSGAPLGDSVGPDGTLYVGNYTNLDKVDRSQGSLSFGEQQNASSPATQTASIYNGGNLPLTISNIALASTGGFTLGTAATNNCTIGAPIAPGAICNLSVTFTTPHAGVFSGTLTITSNSLNTAATIQTIALSAFTYGVYVSATPNPVNFGNIAIGTSSTPQTITFTNNGDLYSASVGNPAFSSAGYTFTPGNCFGVGVGSTCTGTITFSPTAVQSYNGVTASFQASSSGGGPNQSFSITLNGAGVPAPAPAVTLAPATVPFGNQNVGTVSAASAILLTNTGTATLNITGVTLTGTNPTAFALLPSATNPCGATLSAGASCNLSVVFNPSASAPYAATLSVADNATGSPQTVALTGTGTALTIPQLQFFPAQVNLFAGEVGQGCGDTGNGGPALQANFCALGSVAVDATGNTYVVDQSENTVRKIDTNGIVSTFAGVPILANEGTFSGDGGPAATAGLSQPIDVAVDASGNVYIADYENGRVREVNAVTGKISTYAGGGSGYFNGGSANAIAIGPTGLTFDPSGNLYIADDNQQIIVKVTRSGTASAFAGVLTPQGPGVVGYNGDNILAINADLNFPGAVASDAAGNIYIADSGNCRIRKVTASTGIITTVAGNGTCGNTGDNGPATSAEINPRSVAFNLAGDLLFTNGGSIRKVDSNGFITTIAGGGTISGTFGIPATSAAFGGGVNISRVDNDGNLLMPVRTSGYQVVVAGPSGDLQFGNQAVNTTSVPQTVTFENTGNSPLTLSQTTYTATGNFAVTGGTCAGLTSLAPGATCTLTVTFTPATTGALTGSITVASNAPTSSQTIALQGTGTQVLASQALLSPATLPFPSTTVNATAAALTTALSNPGNATLNISSITITGADAADFAISANNCGSTLAAGATCNISATFTPLSAASFSAAISVADDAPAGSPQTAILTGTGTAPLISQAVLAPSALTFASQTINTTSATQMLTLSNPGNATLNISGIAIAGANPADFAISANTCGATLAANATCAISVTFTPLSVATFNAVVNISDDAPAGSPQTATLSGTGTAVPAPIAGISPSTLPFGNQTILTTSTAQTITITNTGNATLTLSNITLGGTNPTAFARTGGSCDAAVSAGSSCTLTYTFTPPSVGSFSAAASIANNAGSPLVAALTGTGTAVPAPVATLTPSTLTFASTNVGTTAASQTLTLSNTGNATLTISGITIGGTNPADFANTTTCAATLAASASCTISVTFTPASAAAFTATLNVADNAAGSPQSATLTGTGIGIGDYAVTATTPSETIQPGGTAQFSINVASLSGDYTLPVGLSVTGLPAGATASFNPASVVPGSAGASSTLTVQAPQLTGALTSPGSDHTPWLAALLLLPLLRVRRFRKLSTSMRIVLFGALALGSIASLTGCGGGYFGPQPQTVTLTVTGTSGSIQHSTTVTLTIQ